MIVSGEFGASKGQAEFFDTSGERRRLGHRRRALWFVSVLAVAVLPLASLWLLRGRFAAHDDPQRVNVLLISLDTTRQDHLSCYGYARKTSPNLDALAEDGWLFRRSVAVSNWTLPSHASMLSGLYPPSHGAHLLADAPVIEVAGHQATAPAGEMHAGCLTLAEVLKADGYQTAAVVANALYLQKAFRLDQGFDHYDDRCACHVCRPGQPGDGPSTPDRRSDEIVDEAIAWLGRERTQPFFLFLNLMDPHAPYFPTEPYDRQFRDEAATRWERRFSGKRQWPAEMGWWIGLVGKTNTHRTEVDPDVQAWLRCQYDGEIAQMDAQVGRLITWLRQQGLYDRTLILVTSDHGENFGEHRVMAHALTLYEQELAVPMILKLPGSAEGGKRPQYPVQSCDVMPTVLDALRLPIPAEVQGVSMLAPSTREVFAVQHFNPDRQMTWPDFETEKWACYVDDLKYIASSEGEEELFDLAADPGEQNDLSHKRPEDVAALRESLRLLRTRFQNVRPGVPAVLRPDAEENLRDLGYVQ